MVDTLFRYRITLATDVRNMFAILDNKAIVAPTTAIFTVWLGRIWNLEFNCHRLTILVLMNRFQNLGTTLWYWFLRQVFDKDEFRFWSRLLFGCSRSIFEFHMHTLYMIYYNRQFIINKNVGEINLPAV